MFRIHVLISLLAVDYLQVLEPDEATTQGDNAEPVQTVEQRQQNRQLQVREKVEHLRFTHSIMTGAHKTQYLGKDKSKLLFYRYKYDVTLGIDQKVRKEVTSLIRCRSLSVLREFSVILSACR